MFLIYLVFYPYNTLYAPILQCVWLYEVILCTFTIQLLGFCSYCQKSNHSTLIITVQTTTLTIHMQVKLKEKFINGDFNNTARP